MVKKIFAYSYVYLILLLMYVPIFVLILYSFMATTYLGEWDWSKLNFDLYVSLFHDTEIMVALGNTLIIAVISSFVSTVLGTLGAIGAFYSKKRARNALESVNQIPVVNSEIVMALSLTVMFVFIGNVIFHKNIFSFWTLLVGHIIISAPFVYLNVKPKLTQMDPSLYEAALDLGCAPRTALRKVLVPQIVPGIVSGFLLSFTLSLDDFIITAFTRGPGLLSGDGNIETLSTLVQAKLKKGPIPMNMRPLTTIIFLVVLVAVIIITIIKNRSAKKVKVRKGRAN